MASATVGSPMMGCQFLIGHWLVMTVGVFLIAVLDDFEQVVALGIVERSEKQIVEDEELDFGQAGKRFEMRAVGFGLEQHFKQARSAQIEHGVALAGSEVAERAGDITFAHAGGTG